jgi:hypothetical protein
MRTRVHIFGSTRKIDMTSQAGDAAAAGAEYRGGKNTPTSMQSILPAVGGLC